MAANLTRRIAMMALAVAVAASLCPSLAFADALAAGQASASERPSLQTQVAKKTVYVLTRIVETEKSRTQYGSAGEIVNLTDKNTVNLTYNAKGLLSKSKYKHTEKNDNTGKPTSTSPYAATRRWIYNKKNQLSSIVKPAGTVKYTLNGSGKPKKAVSKWSYYSTKHSYTYKSGRVSKIGITLSNSPKYKEAKGFTYNKQGKLVKCREKTTGPYVSDYTRTFVYDDKGNLHDPDGDGPVINSYNSAGLLTKRSRSSYSSKTSLGSTYTVTYKYARVKVSKSLASKIQAQQWALLNGNVNLAIDTDINGYTSATNNFA